MTDPSLPSDATAPEMDIAGDLVRRGLPLAPILIGICAVFWGMSGALSSTYAIVLVFANFLLAAGLMTWSAKISLGFMMGMVLFGYAGRLALIFLAVYAVKNFWWFDAWPLGLTLIITHLGLLAWETRYVSASLAFPGLKPPAHPSRETPSSGTTVKESRR
jgi:hypothetical protein